MKKLLSASTHISMCSHSLLDTYAEQWKDCCYRNNITYFHDLVYGNQYRTNKMNIAVSFKCAQNCLGIYLFQECTVQK